MICLLAESDRPGLRNYLSSELSERRVKGSYPASESGAVVCGLSRAACCPTRSSDTPGPAVPSRSSPSHTVWDGALNGAVRSLTPVVDTCRRTSWLRCFSGIAQQLRHGWEGVAVLLATGREFRSKA